MQLVSKSTIVTGVMSGSERISSLDEHLGYWMRLVSNHVSRTFFCRLESKGVTTAEWVFLRTLFDVDAASPSELAVRMGMTRGAISKLAERLIAKKMIVRADHPDDGRAQSLSLTKNGRRLVPELAELADENDADFFDHLTAKERATLETVLKTIAARRGLRMPPID